MTHAGRLGLYEQRRLYPLPGDPRYISLSRPTYNALLRRCDAERISAFRLAEAIIIRALDDAGAP